MLEETMKRVFGYLYLVTLATTMAASPTFAADLPREGNYNIHSCTSGVANAIAFSKDHRVIGIEQWGSTLSNPPGGMLDKGVFHCLGLQTVFAGKDVYSHYCELVFADGDKILGHLSPGPDGNPVRSTVAGTGKYEGLVLSGTVVQLGPYPVVKPGAFQNCNHQTGTYKLR
jgi:hypothetical protein